jgi:hypothetical protein
VNLPSLQNLEQSLAITLCGLFCVGGFTFKAFAPFMVGEYYERLSKEGSELLQQGLGFGFGTGAVSGSLYRKKEEEK